VIEPRPAPRRVPFAVVCVVTWLAAAVIAGPRGIWLGIWLAVGAASVMLGAAASFLDGASVARQLRPTGRLLLTGAVAAAAMLAATYALQPALARAAPAVAHETALLYAAFRGPSPVFAALALGPVVLGEELVWRGVVQAAFTRRFGPVAGVGLAAVTFALAHGPIGSFYLVMVALACGAAWGALRAITGSLVPSLVAHLVWDAVVLLVAPFVP